MKYFVKEIDRYGETRIRETDRTEICAFVNSPEAYTVAINALSADKLIVSIDRH